jgi:hypothetical protein
MLTIRSLFVMRENPSRRAVPKLKFEVNVVGRSASVRRPTTPIARLLLRPGSHYFCCARADRPSGSKRTRSPRGGKTVIGFGTRSGWCLVILTSHHSASRARIIAGAARFLTLSQSRERPAGSRSALRRALCSRWIFGRNQRLDADGDKHASDNRQRRNGHNEERNQNLALPRPAPLASRTT